jgi:hypothetical protein
MPQENGVNDKRMLIFPFFDGVNALVGGNISKRQELFHAENARSRIIGSIEKRQGTRRLGNVITATANYDTVFFENDTSTNNGFYRISTVSGVTSIYYLNSSSVWTALTGHGTKLYELGDSTSQFDITNPAGTTFRYTWDTNGTDPDIDAHVRIGTTVVTAAQNFTAANNGTFTVTAVSTNYFEVTNAAGFAENNKTIGTGSITVSGNEFSHTIAEDCCFLVNGETDNRYITSNGSTVTTATTTTGHLYNSPRARRINYYKDRLYLADYVTTAGTRYKNGIMFSSKPVGIIALVDGDHALGVTSIKLTDTKYVYATDSLDVYRGNTYIQTLSVSAKTENSITVVATTAAISSADEIWVAGTFTGTKVFRWAGNPASGVNVKQYDTFKFSGGKSDRIRMFTNIGDVMLIGNKYNLAVWNDYNLRNFDLGIGCVSDKGYVKALGRTYFIDYTGVYSTDGTSPRLESSAIEPYIIGATKAGLEASCAGRKGMSIFFSIGTVTLYNPDGSAGQTLSDVVLEKDLRQQNWYVHTGLKATFFENYMSSSGVDRLEFASTESGYHIFELFNGELDDRVTSDKEIPFRIDTSQISLSGDFEKICYPKKVIIESERGSGIQCFISLDDDAFYDIEGEAVKGCTILQVTSKDPQVVQPPRCRKLRLSIRDMTKKLCKINRIALVYSETLEEENHRE